MIEIGYFMTIITLYKQGESQRKIARLVGHDRKTVRRIIKLYKEKGVIEPIRKQKESSLDGYKELIIELMEKDISGVRIADKRRFKNQLPKRGTVFRKHKRQKQRLCEIPYKGWRRGTGRFRICRIIAEQEW